MLVSQWVPNYINRKIKYNISWSVYKKALYIWWTWYTFYLPPRLGDLNLEGPEEGVGDVDLDFLHFLPEESYFNNSLSMLHNSTNF